MTQTERVPSLQETGVSWQGRATEVASQSSALVREGVSSMTLLRKKPATADLAASLGEQTLGNESRKPDGSTGSTGCSPWQVRSKAVCRAVGRLVDKHAFTEVELWCIARILSSDEFEEAEEERALGGICGNPLCEASLTDVHSSGQQPAVAGRPGGPEEEQDDDAAAGLYCCPACEAAMHSFAERLGSHPEAQHRFAVLLQQARQRRARTGARHAALRNQRHHLGAPAGVGPASTAVAVQGAQAQRQASRPLSSPFASAAGVGGV